MKARNLELSLLLLVVMITGVGYWLVTLGIFASVPTNTVFFVATVLSILLATHIVIRIFAPFADGVLFPIAALLNSIGYLMIARLAPEIQEKARQNGAENPPDLAANQVLWIFIGLLVFSIVLVMIGDIKWIEQYKYLFALLGVSLLISPLLPFIGLEVNGSKIWLDLGFFTIQPGEFAKVVLACFLAGYLTSKRELLQIKKFKFGPFSLPPLKYLAPLLFAWFVAIMIMVSQKDLGSSLIFFTLFLGMVYVATARVTFVVIGLSIFSVAGYVAWTQFTHVQTRVDQLLNPYQNPPEQLDIANYAMADGGILGRGIGQGSPENIPEAETDMIFAAIGEELGLVGTTALLALFLLFVSAGIRVALSAKSNFESLLALGLTFLIGFQTFVIIGGIVRVLPLTGVTIPFVSYGGSSLVANYVILAILVKISHNSVKQETKSWESPGLSADQKVKWKEVKL